MNRLFSGVIIVLAVAMSSFAYASDIAQHLQDVSVTIKSASDYSASEGSGVLITRELKVKGKDVKVNFVWTAAHVIDNLRSTRQVIGKDGQKKTVVEFRDAQIVKELVERGRKVGELKMDAKVILYSDADEGQDLALLMVRKQGFVDANAAFYLDGDKQVDIGTQLFHVGSLLGQSGANSMTSGIMSQVGRVLQLGSGGGTVFDQTTCAAFPGSSGGGVFKTDGKYVGMLVRGAGETFNLIVPVRRMHKWASKRDVLWALDPTINMPTLEQIQNIEPEDAAADHDVVEHSDAMKDFRFWIRETKIKDKE